MKARLLKYKIGLLILGLFTIGLVGFVVMEADKTRADLQTKAKATKVAEKLNSYVYQQGVPDSLSTAGIKDVPATVHYAKLSDTKYRFCVTYKAANSGFNPDTAVQDAITGYYASQLGARTEPTDYLYIDGAHKKGENCQVVKVQAASNSFFDFDYPSSSDTPSFNSNPDLFYSQPDSLNTDSYQYPVQ